MSLSILDIKKVVDQTVRDIKREVNRNILKVPEIEIKTLDATSNEPWGPHGSLLKEIAQSSFMNNEVYLILGVLWKRLEDTGKNWRHVYKALIVTDFLIANGSELMVNEIRENAFLIHRLIDFHYLEPSGKDQGINVRTKAENLLILIKSKEKIAEARQKALATKDKYSGVSSMASRSGFGSGMNDYNDGDKYHGDKSAESNYYKDRYDVDRDFEKSKDRFADNYEKEEDGHGYGYGKEERSKYDANESKKQFSSFKSSNERRRNEHVDNGENRGLDSPNLNNNSNKQNAQSNNKHYANLNDNNYKQYNNYPSPSLEDDDDDFDDFDPRATATKNPPVPPPSQPSADFFSSFTENQSQSQSQKQEDLFLSAAFHASPVSSFPAQQNAFPPPPVVANQFLPAQTPAQQQVPRQQAFFSDPIVTPSASASAFPSQPVPSFSPSPLIPPHPLSSSSSSPLQSSSQSSNLLSFSSPVQNNTNSNSNYVNNSNNNSKNFNNNNSNNNDGNHVSHEDDFDFDPRNSSSSPSPPLPSAANPSSPSPLGSVSYPLSTASQTDLNPKPVKPAKPTVWDDVMSKGLLDLNIKSVNEPFKDLGISMPTTLATARSGSLKMKQEETKPQTTTVGMGMSMNSMNSMRASANYSSGFR